MKVNVTKILFIIILFLAFSLRVYKLDSVPPSISWDEAAVGYNAWTIANYGKDEYGQSFPLYFKSFGDDKHPVHIYSTAVFVKLLGLSKFSIRLPSAVFGTLNVILIFFLTNLLFKNQKISLIASFFLAISPQNIQFSRFNHEANFALFFFMLGLVLFFLFLKKKNNYLPFSVLSFLVSFFTYHPAKVVVPIMFLVLLAFYIKDIFQDKKNMITSAFIILFCIIILIFNPQLLGLSRINQTALNEDQISKTQTFKVTGNKFLGRINLYVNQYIKHFSPQFLFISGDKNPKLSSQSTGEFYKMDAIFLILGFFYLLFRKSREGIIILVWALVAPIPSAFTAEAPHAARSLFMMGSWTIISAVGFNLFVYFFKKPVYKRPVIVISLLAICFMLVNYLNYYFGEYATRYAIDWQYGMKQIVEYVKENPQYNQVYMTDVRSQPYIFFLYYLKVPQPDFSAKVIYNNSESKSYSTVSLFDRYSFGGWDPIESIPERWVLYIITPSQYDGLRKKSSFEVKNIVYYPNKSIAFYLISGI